MQSGFRCSAFQKPRQADATCLLNEVIRKIRILTPKEFIFIDHLNGKNGYLVRILQCGHFVGNSLLRVFISEIIAWALSSIPKISPASQCRCRGVTPCAALYAGGAVIYDVSGDSPLVPVLHTAESILSKRAPQPMIRSGFASRTTSLEGLSLSAMNGRASNSSRYFSLTSQHFYRPPQSGLPVPVLTEAGLPEADCTRPVPVLFQRFRRRACRFRRKPAQ